MNDVQILEWWAKFHQMPYERKRELLTNYLTQKTGIGCEIRLYRSITRVSMQTYKEKLGKLLQDDIAVQKALQEIGISTNTALNWYIQTKKRNPLKPDRMCIMSIERLMRIQHSAQALARHQRQVQLSAC